MYKLYQIAYTPAIKEMKGNRGRMVVQGAHGFLHAYWDAEFRFPDAVKAYRAQTAFKMVLATDDLEFLKGLYEKYRSICGVSLVEETGSRMNGEIREEYKAITGLGLGPISEELIGDDLKSLKSFL